MTRRGNRVVVTSVFETDIENIWCKIQDIDTLREICKPKASFISYDNIPLIWKEGETFYFRMFLHRFIPIGKHTINVIKIDKNQRKIVSNEYNKRVTVWNHYIQMEKITEIITRYTDSVELYAGYLTPFVAWWTLKFYKHRQKKAENCKGLKRPR